MRKEIYFGWLLLLVSSMLLFPLLWTGHSTWYTDDLVNLNIPQRELLGAFYRAGKFSLWNPYSFAGQPFLASIQSGPLYPINFLFIVLPLVPALNVSFLFHWLLGTCGMYSYLLQLRARPAAAFVGAFVFGTCGFWLAHVMHTQMSNAVAWIPVLFALVEAYFRTRLKRYAFIFSLGLALQILAGHPQINFYTLLMLVPYILVVNWRDITLWVGAVFALWISSAQLLPTYELIQRSTRRAISYDFFSEGSLPFDWWASLVFPFWHGGGYTAAPGPLNFQFWEYAGYCGWVALTLAVGSLFTYKWEKRTFFWVGAAVFGVVMALGNATPALQIAFHLPGFNSFRISARYVLFVDLAVSVLVGVGLQSLAKSAKGLLISALLGSAGMWATYLLCVHQWQPWPGFSFHQVRAAFLIPLIWVVATYLLVLIVGWMDRSRSSFGRVASYSVTGNGVFWVLLLAVLSENALFGIFEDQYALKSAASVTAHPSFAKFLRNDPGTYPVPSPQHDAYRVASFSDVLWLERGARYGIETINGYDSLFTQIYANYLDMIWYPGVIYYSKSHLDLLNTRYIIVDPHQSQMTPPLRIQNGETIPGVTANQLSLSALLPKQAWPDSTEVTFYYHDSLNLRKLQEQYGRIDGYTDAHAAVIMGNGSGHAEQSKGMDLPLAGETGRSMTLQLGSVRNLHDIWIRNDLWDGTLTIDRIEFLNGKKLSLDLPIRHSIKSPAWNQVYAGSDGTVLQNPTAYPRYWAGYTGDWQVPLAAAQTTIVSRDVDRSTVDVKMPQAGFLVMSQLYYPGWYASVDSRPPQPLEMLYPLAGIALDQGQHHVVFFYDPPSWKRGLFISSAGLLAWVVWIVILNRRRVW